VTDRPSVYVSPHALDRAQARYPETRELDRPSLAARIVYEVAEALRSDRRAKRAPRWASGRLQRQKAGGKGRRTGWFVWNEDETRCYLIVKPRYDSGTPKDYVVVTALRRVD
jgi:hypothetical protein